MNINKLKAYIELSEKATPGPWEAMVPGMTGEWPSAKVKPLKIEGKHHNHPMIKTQDAEFIAQSREWGPKCAKALMRALVELERVDTWQGEQMCTASVYNIEEDEFGHMQAHLHSALDEIDKILKGEE